MYICKSIMLLVISGRVMLGFYSPGEGHRDHRHTHTYIHTYKLRTFDAFMSVESVHQAKAVVENLYLQSTLTKSNHELGTTESK